jgi:hypothetical protein
MPVMSMMRAGARLADRQDREDDEVVGQFDDRHVDVEAPVAARRAGLLRVGHSSQSGIDEPIGRIVILAVSVRSAMAFIGVSGFAWLA